MTTPLCPRTCDACDGLLVRDVFDPDRVDARYWAGTGWLCPVCADRHRDRLVAIREAELRLNFDLVDILCEMLAAACALSTCYECPVHKAGQPCGESCEAALLSLALDRLPD